MILEEKATDAKICVSVATSDFADCSGIAQSSAMVELRLDLMLPDLEQVKELLLRRCRGRLLTIATCREGKLSLTERLQQLQFAIRHGASYVDIEVEADKTYREALVRLAGECGCKVIISYHNFEQTPGLPEMRKIIADCRSMSADVVKLVTTAHTVHDNAKVLSLYEGESNLVAFAMGSIGKITRLACLYLGAPFTYASPASGLEAAPGQITAEDMSIMIQMLRNDE